MSRPRLIITADDYGMSPHFDQAVRELAFAGIITSASVMIRRPYLDPAAMLALPIALGLHLELEPTTPLEEVELQIDRFKDLFGKLPSYLDGHQHQHLAPRYLEAVIHTAKRHSLPVRSRFAEDRSLLRSARVLTPDNFISWHPDRTTVLKKRLLEAQKFAVSELVVHPGYFDQSCAYPYNREREAELSFLKSHHFRSLVNSFDRRYYRSIGFS